MEIIPMLLKEMNEEAETTRKMLKIVPDDKFGWKPHEKSMTIKQLVTHIADIPTWIGMTLNTSQLDFQENPYQPEDINTNAELMDFFENNYKQAHTDLAKFTEPELLKDWTLRNGDHVILVRTKAEVVRMVFSQIVHHRAQLGVFLRLLNIPIPGSYGPSADEM